MSEDVYISGRIIKFDMGRNLAIIETELGERYKCSYAEFDGEIPKLNSYPAVLFKLDGDTVRTVKFDPDAPPMKFAPASGWAIRGAQKCINCNWRLPIVTQKHYKNVRNGQSMTCPKCGQGMKLKSWFNHVHRYVGLLLLVSAYISYRFIPFIDLWAFSILLFLGLFVFVYAQGKFVPIDVDEVFE